ncbi:helix-turn-helix domain-containing protein [Streptomyces sp. NPDC057302]|uniref:helix-turn-helix domain-containing protein n=1 Tax=Streptomyces sp. NPDC057302 TaxID=3346094 RepID=UPI003633739E
MDRDRDWVHLGRALKTDRKRQGLTQEEVADRLTAGLSSVQAIERGQEYTKPTRTIRAYASLLHWTEDSVDQVLAGGDPNHVHHVSAHMTAAKQGRADVDLEDQRLPLRIVHELSDDGELLDTTVIKIGERGRAVIVVKGEPGVSPDELVEELQAWARARARLESGDATEPPAATDGS